MNLTVVEKNILTALPVQQKQFVQAKLTNTIKSYSDRELADEITDLVQITLIESGVKDLSDEKVITFISDTLLKDLQTPKFNHLSLGEVKLALHLGVRFEYGQFMGVNVSTIHFWIKSFLNDKNRQKAIEEYFGKVYALQNNIPDKNTPVNPEGQKKVVEALKDTIKSIPEDVLKPKPVVKPFREKTEREKKIQDLFLEFTKTPGEEFRGKKYIKVEGYELPLDEVEYVEFKIKQYDEAQLG